MQSTEHMDPTEKLVKVITNLESDNAHKIIAICGAADLGKTHLAQMLLTEFNKHKISAAHLTMDSYLVPREKRISLGISGYELEAYDIESLKNDLSAYKENGQSIEFNEYDHMLGIANGPRKTISACSHLLLDGLHSMCDPVWELIDYSIFIYTTDQQLNEIRHRADIAKRKQSKQFSLDHLELELEKYRRNVEPYKQRAYTVLKLDRKWQYVEQIS